jgi:hypothetical protein
VYSSCLYATPSIFLCHRWVSVCVLCTVHLSVLSADDAMAARELEA